MSSAFCYNDNYDIDAIVAEYDKKKTEEKAKVYVDFDVLYFLFETAPHRGGCRGPAGAAGDHAVKECGSF